MAARTSAAKRLAGHSLVITRLLDAPRSLVFKVWTDPEHMVRWWGPRDFTTTSLSVDARPGGAYRICIRSPKGEDHGMRGVFREVVAPERLVFTFAWEDEKGMPGHETLVTVTFAEARGKTKLSFRQGLFETASSRDAHREGWGESLDLLAAYLAKRQGGGKAR